MLELAQTLNIFWRIEDIENALQKAGFSSCEDNVESIMNHVYFTKSLEENSISKGWDIIEDTISELKDSLIISVGHRSSLLKMHDYILEAHENGDWEITDGNIFKD